MADPQTNGHTEVVEKAVPGGLMVEVGRTGLSQMSGYIYEEFARDLRGSRAIKTYREMRDNDSVIGALFFAIEMLMRQVDWRVEPAEEDAAGEWSDFVEGAMHDLSITWEDTLSNILSFLQFGWELSEICYKIRDGYKGESSPKPSSAFDDGKIGWRKFAPRAQETLWRWEFDDTGGVQGMWQIIPGQGPVLIPIEKALLFRTSTRKGSPEGMSILRSAYTCFASDTELLTGTGWKPVGEVSRDDDVATLNPVTDALEYQRPSEVWDYDYEGNLVHASSRFVDQLVTPNHRMWVRRAHRDEFEFIAAEDCAVSVSFAATADWNAPDAETIRVGTQEVDADLWMEFMGWWLAEGWTYKYRYQHTVGLCQREGARADRIRAVVEKLPWSCYERTDSRGLVRWIFTRKELWEALAPLGKAKTKRIPRDLLQLSARQLNLLLDAYTLGDGSLCGKPDEYLGTEVIFTSSKGMADDLMEIAFKGGYRPACRPVARKGFSEEPGDLWAVTLGKPFHNRMRASWGEVPYEGKVYCVTTENGIVYTRRNGKATWSGNSWYYKKHIAEIEAIGIERDLAGLPVMESPRKLFDANASNDDKHTKQVIDDLVRNIKRNDQDGVHMPQEFDDRGNKMYDLHLLSSGGRRQVDTDAIITRYDQRIAMSVLADFILIGHERMGSYALSVSKIEVFATALSAWLDSIMEVFNAHAIPRLLALNGVDPMLAPKMTHAEVQRTDLDQIGTYMKNLAASGMPLFPDTELESYLRGAADLPEQAATSEQM